MYETTPANTSSIIKRGVTLLALLILTETSFLENPPKWDYYDES
jgi:hypothetical protein